MAKYIKSFLSLLLVSCLFVDNYVFSMELIPKRRRVIPFVRQQPTSSETQAQLPREPRSLTDLNISKLAHMLTQSNSLKGANELINERFNTLPIDLKQKIIIDALKQEFAQPWNKKNFRTKSTKSIRAYLSTLANIRDRDDTTQAEKFALQDTIVNYLNRTSYRYGIISDRFIKLSLQDLVTLLYIGTPENKERLLTDVVSDNLSENQKQIIDQLENIRKNNILYLALRNTNPLELEIGDYHLNITNNKNLRSLEGFDEIIKNPQYLTQATIQNSQLTTLPPEIGMLTHLQRMSFNNNQLIVLPPEIGNFTRLLDLILSNNQLTVLPPEIGKLTQLEELYLNNNKLTDITFNGTILKAFANFKKLRRLDLSGNQISLEKQGEIRKVLPPNTEVIF
jgi:hypothetical protein